MKTYLKALRGSLGLTKIRFVITGEKRAPRKGEWYISGAIPEAYRAPHDLPETCSYYIAREVTR